MFSVIIRILLLHMLYTHIHSLVGSPLAGLAGTRTQSGDRYDAWTHEHKNIVSFSGSLECLEVWISGMP